MLREEFKRTDLTGHSNIIADWWLLKREEELNELLKEVEKYKCGKHKKLQAILKSKLSLGE